jgi:Cu(I)/Ag(I) efflux system membrane protein CusA/SilA
LKPQSQWEKVRQERWYSTWMPDALKPVLRPIWPEERPKSWEELTAAMNERMQLPGWTNAWTMPVKTRVDMLTTGIRTPIGVKVFGTDLNEIETVGTTLERLLSRIPGTRSVLYERNLGGLYLDVIPRREVLARHGLRIGDVQRTIEAAIGGTPISVAVEGRNRFSVNVRYPQDLRSDIDALKQVLVPVGANTGMGQGGMPPGTTGALDEWLSPRDEPASSKAEPRWLLAQAMPEMGADPGANDLAIPRISPPTIMSDVPMPSMPSPASMMKTAGAMGPGGGMPGVPAPGRDGVSTAPSQRFVPLGEVADIKIVGGPPMVRDEDGLLVGYVYVDIDQKQRDIGGYVVEAKDVVRNALAQSELRLPTGYFLKWTGQYEQLEEMVARMKVLIPLTVMIIVVLLFLYFRSIAEVLIVLLSIPFALVGTVWLLWLLDYRVSTAVWIGVIALAGLAAQTGIVMIVYIDHALEERRRAGKLRNLSDVIAAHMEGTVQRVRPKLMTVSTMLVGLVPLLWATGSGADVMKRIAAPMVGGLITSAFLTLEIIPVISTYWRQEQLLWEQLAPLDPRRLWQLQAATIALGLGWALTSVMLIAPVYVEISGALYALGLTASALLILGGTAWYLLERPAARRRVWPVERQGNVTT